MICQYSFCRAVTLMKQNARRTYLIRVCVILDIFRIIHISQRFQMMQNNSRPSARQCQRKKKQQTKDPDSAVYQDCPLMKALCSKLPKVIISKGMLNMNSISMQNKVCEKQQNLKKRDIPSDVNHHFQNLNPPSSLIKHLDLQYFKITLCPCNDPHEFRQCPYYHDNNDRRRPEQIYGYDMCPLVKDGQECPAGNKCVNSHNVVEQIYGANKYKTKFCKYYPDRLQECEYGFFCPCAHSEEDIKSDLLCNLDHDGDFYMFYFKTVCCPFPFKPHDQDRCPYAHCQVEWRRKLQKYYFEPEVCKAFMAASQLPCAERCPNGLTCSYSHTDNEYNYHPLIYKTRVCQNVQTCKRHECSFYHSEHDKRKIDQQLLYRIFKLVPRNRIIEETYKTRFKDKQELQCQYQNQFLAHCAKP